MNVENERNVKLIDGEFKHLPNEKIFGYCNCDLHKGYLTKKLYDEHDCKKKECGFFYKNKNHPYWVGEAIKKEKKKKSLQDKEEAEQNLRNELDIIFQTATQFVQDKNIPITIVKVFKDPYDKKRYIINYIPDDYFEDRKFTELGKALSKKYRARFVLKRVRWPDKRYVTLDEWNARNNS